MKVSNENEKYNKESNSEILGITKYNDELIEKEKKYMQIKNDIINILLEHEQINKHLDTKYYVDPDQGKSKFISASNTEITCKIHGVEFLIIDSVKFMVECSKCLEIGDRKIYLQLKEKKITLLSNIQSEKTAEGFECYLHPKTNSEFYCDDCKVFLCKTCFSNQHRAHSSNILSEIAAKYKLSLYDLITSINDLKPKLEESSKHLGEIDKQIKNLRKETFDTISNTSTKINTIVDNKYQKELSQFEAIFMGNDTDTESVVNRLESLYKVVIKYISELNEILSVVNSKSNDFEICKFIKTKHNRLEEIRNTIEEKKNFIFYKVNDTKNKVYSKIQDFDTFIENINKQIKIYKISVLSSINTGISSSSLRLRRFYNMKSNTKYFKTSAVECQFSGSICLVGLGICGLYAGVNENNGKLNEKKLELVKTNKNLIKIAISEIRINSENIYENLLTEEHFLTFIINSNDPVISIYFNKALILKQDRRYLITCINLNKDVLTPRWYGEVGKKLLKNKSQFILCNTSGIGFTFSEANGIESDFDEYCSGIIAEFIFSYI